LETASRRDPGLSWSGDVQSKRDAGCLAMNLAPRSKLPRKP
jgi:hypothetical protein